LGGTSVVRLLSVTSSGQVNCLILLHIARDPSQAHRHARALMRRTFRTNTPARRFNNAADGRKASSTTAGLCREEWIECSDGGLVVHAVSRVTHHELKNSLTGRDPFTKAGFQIEARRQPSLHRVH